MSMAQSRPDRYTNTNTHTYTNTHTHRRNELTYSHIPILFITNVNQLSNSVTYQSTAMDNLKIVSKETETCRGEF